jgi:hypothetical protein
MIVNVDLVHPFRARRAELMAPEAQAYIELGQLLSRVLHVLPARAVTCFARKTLMIAFGQFLGVVRMALNARGFSSPKGSLCCDVLQRVRPVMAVLPKGRRRQEVACREKEAHDGDRQQHQADNLRRHFQKAGHLMLFNRFYSMAFSPHPPR